MTAYLVLHEPRTSGNATGEYDGKFTAPHDKLRSGEGKSQRLRSCREDFGAELLLSGGLDLFEELAWLGSQFER